MTVMHKSSDVQQNFGKVMEQALTEDDVIVERYGEPRVVIMSYQRYQQLLQLEQGGSSVHLTPPQRSQAAKEQGQALAKQVRHELEATLDASLDEVMASLRGRAWSS